jgi:hypothetical protein
MAMTLLTTALLEQPKRHATLVAAGWAFINIAFEVAQHPLFAPALAARIPSAWDEVWLLSALRPLLTRGTFDWFDIAGACVGAIFALVLIRKEFHRAPLH